MFTIGQRQVGDEFPCFIVAEAGLAHMGKLENAYKLIDMAVDAGVDAVKFQIYKTKELISKERSPEWYDRYAKKELPYDDFRKMKQYAEDRKMIWFATPHVESAFEYLKMLGVPCYKVGSGEHDNRFIDKIADTGKPLVISTGLRTHFEIMRLVDRYGSPNSAFLHCVTLYPAIESSLNLGFIGELSRHCAVSHSVVGYSDHTEGTYACELAVMAGSKIIEKHICLPESEGQDVQVSLKGSELDGLVQKVRRIEIMKGSGLRYYSDHERQNEEWALKSQSDGRRPA